MKHTEYTPSEAAAENVGRKLVVAPRRIAVVYRPIADLLLNRRNPRRHSRTQIRRLVRVIRKWGFLVPILIDGQGNVIAGHARLIAAGQDALTEVPCIVIDHLTEAELKALMIADNRLSELSEWDDRLLAEHLRELSILDFDFDLQLTGFDLGEIDFRIEQLNTYSDSNPDPADDLSTLQNAPPVTRRGDLWLLDENRVYCGDALEVGSYLTLMNRSKAAVVVSDVPYNLPIAGTVSGLGRVKHGDFVMASGEMSESEFIGFLRLACSLLVRHSSGGSLHYIFIDWRHVAELLAAGKAVYNELINMAVWVKDSPGMGSFYRSQHELVCIFQNGAQRHRNNIELGRFGRNRSNVWRYPGANSFLGRSSEEMNVLEHHPTPKPVALLADIVLDSTARGEIVLDAFLGSGSTVIAAARVGRRCYGIEISPRYVDVSVRRWQAFTRGQARHAASGRTFDDLATERKAQDAQK